MCDRRVVILGDFNCVCDTADRAPSRSRLDKSEQVLLDVIEESDLIDVASFQPKGNNLIFTHFQQASHARPDRIYCSLDLINQLSAYVVNPVFSPTTVWSLQRLGKSREEKSQLIRNYGSLMLSFSKTKFLWRIQES